MSGGVAAGLAEAMEAVEEVEAAVQASLFDLAVEDTGALDTASPFSESLKLRGPGRPQGAKGKRTSETTAWLLSMHRHPLAVIMEGYSMSPVAFAESIGLQKPWESVEVGSGDTKAKIRKRAEHYDNGVLLEIIKLQLRMAEAALPYIAQKQPMAVQLEGKAGLTVSFEGVSLPARAALAGAGEVVEGTAMHLALPFKSDDPSRKDD